MLSDEGLIACRLRASGGISASQETGLRIPCPVESYFLCTYFMESGATA